MKHLPVCDAHAIDAIARGLKAASLGKPVSFEFDAGMNRHHEGDKVIEVPNGTMTFRLYVNGGAVNQDVPEKTPEAVPA